MSWLYRRTGEDTFESSPLTRTGWNDTDQHGGPPSALLAHVIQDIELPVPMQMSRITISLMRAVPIAPLRTRTRILRAGRRVAVVEADLIPVGSEEPVATAQAQMIRIEQVPLGDVPRPAFSVPTPPMHHPPAIDQGSGRWSDPSTERFHLHAIERRSIDGSWERLGPGEGWFHLTCDVLDGEEISDLTRAVCVADIANGLSTALEFDDWMWVNPDITVAFSRPPQGEWLGMRAGADPQSHGVGLVHSWFFDEEGPFGHILQTQLLVSV